MTPGQARLVLSSFVLIAAGVTINALFLQRGATATGRAATTASVTKAPAERAQASKAAAPRASKPSPEEKAVRVARFKPDSARIEALPEPPAPEAGPETVRAIQRELGRHGYGPLASDGVVRVSTRAAIMAYEHDQGLPLSGEATETLLKRILLGTTAAPEQARGGTIRTTTAEQIVTTVQQGLAALGYQPGPADGRPGTDTVRAIREFEVDHGMVPTGRISAGLVTRLAEAQAPTRTAGR